MERLTIDEIIGHCDRKVEMYEKACDVKYLETAVMGNGIKEYWEHKQVAEYLKKLKEYEDLEEQGLLLRLPCRVGTIVYVLQSDRIIKVIITRYDCFKDGSIWFCFNHGCGKSIAEFGKTVFLTRDGAEAKLKELRGGENER